MIGQIWLKEEEKISENRYFWEFLFQRAYQIIRDTSGQGVQHELFWFLKHWINVFESKVLIGSFLFADFAFPWFKS